jgi:hypothetical protein
VIRVAGHAVGPEGDDGVRSHDVYELTDECCTPGNRDPVASPVAHAESVVFVNAKRGQAGGKFAPAYRGHGGGCLDPQR